MSLVKYNPRSRLASLPPEIAVVWAICLSLLLVFNNSIGGLIVLDALLVLLFLVGTDLSALLKLVKYIWPLLLLIFLIHLFYHKGSPIFNFWFLNATVEGVAIGATNCLRFIGLTLVAFAAIACISPYEFSRRLAHGFGIVRSRYLKDLALIFFIAMRFVPVFVKEIGVVRLTMLARGADFSGGLIKRAGMNTRLLLPLFTRVFHQVEDVAATLTLKSHNGEYFAAAIGRLRKIDMILILAPIVIVALIFSV